MPARSQRNKRKDSAGDSVATISAKQNQDLGVEGLSQCDFHNLSTQELLQAISERNKDPVIDRMLKALASKIPEEVSAGIEAEKRGRSLVIAGLPESSPNLRPSAKQSELEAKVGDLLDVLGVECRPLEIYRLGKAMDTHPRLVKLVLPSRSYWITALSNSYRLRNSGFRNVYIRRSMTAAERKVDHELRQECKIRNDQAKSRMWVVYRGELKLAQDLPKSRASGNE
ncbi:hypothetical protein V3C99_012840 [Haemonchus contortus]